ncbi:MAG TPA: alpha/beta hydrolase [Xanthobacteraceae bacterium]|nr:alpha/beta hydrolase [Xanthobacteraceae bacterium]
MKDPVVRFAHAAWALAVAAPLLVAAQIAPAQTYAVDTRPNVEYVVHEGVKLTGDFYLPKGLDKAPVIVAVHGGGWQAGSPDSLNAWAPFMARHGYAVYAIRYRLSKPGVSSYPAAVYDVKAAVQFVRAKAGEFGFDPARVALAGASAGAHLASLVGIAGGEPQFSTQYRDDPNAAVPADVKAVISYYGVYDMQAQWTHDVVSRPVDSITEKFLGVPPMKNRHIYFEASPVAYATVDKNRTRFMLIHGQEDDIVDPKQATEFHLLLKQAGFSANIALVPGAGHAFMNEPQDETISFSAQVAPRVLRFLKTAL